jgi:Ser/Thr protein kinase RdoA (MazF antagonist)
MKEIRVMRSFAAPSALAEVIAEEYDFSQPVSCKLFSKMLRTQDNDHYQVKVGSHKYVARIYQQGDHLGRQESDYHFEIDWLNYLKENGIAVSYPIPRRDGSFLGRLQAPEGVRYYALFSFAEGHPMSAGDQEQLFSMGQQMARIHQVSNNFTTPHHRPVMDLTFLVDKPAERIHSFWANRQDDKLDILLTSAQEAKEGIEALLAGPAQTANSWGPIGGDFHPINVHFNKESKPTFFNFDLCGYGWRAYDIAAFLLNAELLQKSSQLSEAFFAGYYSVRPLSSNEHEAIAHFLTIRRIWLTGNFSVVDNMVGHTFIAPM